jgi:hypothetical protein
MLTLVEASRFSDMTWKRFVVGQAEVVVCGLQDWYLQSCIATSQCSLCRIAGKMEQAASNLDKLGETGPLRITDPRTNSAVGRAAIQRSLNCVQVEDLPIAAKLLGDWSPLNQRPSPMEEAVLVRKDILLGRILRFQGKFQESLEHLQRARKTTEQTKGLVFEEDFRDIISELADTLRELDNPVASERYLRAEISRRDQNFISAPGGSALELSLAEALFAQGHIEDAEKLCLTIQSQPKLLKFEKLRLHITMAKILHSKSDNEGALSCWSAAMGAIRKFHMTNGRTTRIIVLSICESLSRLGHTDIVRESMKQVDQLDGLAKPGGIHYWIAGLRSWLENLQSRERYRSRM